MRGRVGEEKVDGIPPIHREGMGGEGLLAQEHAQGVRGVGTLRRGEVELLSCCLASPLE